MVLQIGITAACCFSANPITRPPSLDKHAVTMVCCKKGFVSERYCRKHSKDSVDNAVMKIYAAGTSLKSLSNSMLP